MADHLALAKTKIATVEAPKDIEEAKVHALIAVADELAALSATLGAR